MQTNKLKDFFISSMFLVNKTAKNSYLISESGNQVGSVLKYDTVFHLPKFIDLFSSNNSKQSF